MNATGTSVTSHLIVKHADRAIDFYKQAFGATELFRMLDPGDGRVGHAELRFGESVVMLADEYPDFGALGPDTIGGSPVILHLRTDDVDALTQQAVAAGATLLRAPADQEYGDRMARVLDPFGQAIEQVSPEEMQRRWSEGSRQ